MTEEIIIDGVNVARCEFFDNGEVKNACLLGYREDAVNNFSPNCEDNPDCYYKQLKRLEQDSKQLTQWLDEARRNADFWCDKCTSLEQENKSLYEEKNCLHKIIDRLLENAGYSKDIASAEDFEDVYENMQIKRNELVELEQENERLKKEVRLYDCISKWGEKECHCACRCLGNEFCNDADKRINKYKSALEEIREKIKSLNKDICNNCGWYNTDNCQPNGYVCHDLIEIKNKINEVLNA